MFRKYLKSDDWGKRRQDNKKILSSSRGKIVKKIYINSPPCSSIANKNCPLNYKTKIIKKKH